MGDPRRLLDDSSGDGFGRALLEGGFDAGPDDAQVGALWSALGGRLPLAKGAGAPSPGTAGGGAGTSGVAAAGTGVLTKALAVVAAVGVAAVGVVIAAPRGVPRPTAIAAPGIEVPVGPPASEAAGSTRATEVRAPEAPSHPETSPRDPDPDPVPPAAPRRPSPALPAHPKVVTGASDLGAETAIVLRGRDALRAGDCEGALAALDGARARFAGGGLAEEREALAIEALACAGRHDEAASRAAAFLSDYPVSLHAEAMRRFVR